jgi:hypothetical protein
MPKLSTASARAYVAPRLPPSALPPSGDQKPARPRSTPRPRSNALPPLNPPTPKTTPTTWSRAPDLSASARSMWEPHGLLPPCWTAGERLRRHPGLLLPLGGAVTATRTSHVPPYGLPTTYPTWELRLQGDVHGAVSAGASQSLDSLRGRRSCNARGRLDSEDRVTTVVRQPAPVTGTPPSPRRHA